MIGKILHLWCLASVVCAFKHFRNRNANSGENRRACAFDMCVIVTNFCKYGELCVTNEESCRSTCVCDENVPGNACNEASEITMPSKMGKIARTATVEPSNDCGGKICINGDCMETLPIGFKCICNEGWFGETCNTYGAVFDMSMFDKQPRVTSNSNSASFGMFDKPSRVNTKLPTQDRSTNRALFGNSMFDRRPEMNSITPSEVENISRPENSWTTLPDSPFTRPDLSGLFEDTFTLPRSVFNKPVRGKSPPEVPFKVSNSGIPLLSDANVSAEVKTSTARFEDPKTATSTFIPIIRPSSTQVVVIDTDNMEDRNDTLSDDDNRNTTIATTASTHEVENNQVNTTEVFLYTSSTLSDDDNKNTTVLTTGSIHKVKDSQVNTTEVFRHISSTLSDDDNTNNSVSSTAAAHQVEPNHVKTTEIFTQSSSNITTEEVTTAGTTENMFEVATSTNSTLDIGDETSGQYITVLNMTEAPNFTTTSNYVHSKTILSDLHDIKKHRNSSMHLFTNTSALKEMDVGLFEIGETAQLQKYNICSENFIKRPVKDRNCDLLHHKTCIYGKCEQTEVDHGSWKGYITSCKCDPGARGTFCENKCCLDCGINGKCDVIIDGDNVTEHCNCRQRYTGLFCEIFVPDPVNDKEWDAFISYKSHPTDESFVVDVLYPKLERELGYKLCLHFRDFVPGETISNNIINAVEGSRRTIIILTPRYIESEFTQFEYQKAQTEMLKRKHRIIPIMLEDISSVSANMDKNLKGIINSVTYLEWPKENDKSKKEEKFWKRLQLSLPKKKALESGKEASFPNSPIYSDNKNSSQNNPGHQSNHADFNQNNPSDINLPISNSEMFNISLSDDAEEETYFEIGQIDDTLTEMIQPLTDAEEAALVRVDGPYETAVAIDTPVDQYTSSGYLEFRPEDNPPSPSVLRSQRRSAMSDDSYTEVDINTPSAVLEKNSHRFRKANSYAEFELDKYPPPLSECWPQGQIIEMSENDSFEDFENETMMPTPLDVEICSNPAICDSVNSRRNGLNMHEQDVLVVPDTDKQYLEFRPEDNPPSPSLNISRKDPKLSRKQTNESDMDANYFMHEGDVLVVPGTDNQYIEFRPEDNPPSPSLNSRKHPKFSSRKFTNESETDTNHSLHGLDVLVVPGTDKEYIEFRPEDNPPSPNFSNSRKHPKVSSRKFTNESETDEDYTDITIEDEEGEITFVSSENDDRYIEINPDNHFIDASRDSMVTSRDLMDTCDPRDPVLNGGVILSYDGYIEAHV
ncbi:hypothetical protein ACF0H5_019641 [Mactra antiquata]